MYMANVNRAKSSHAWLKGDWRGWPVEAKMRLLEKLKESTDGAVCDCFGGRQDVRVYRAETSRQDADRDSRPGARCELCGRPKHVLQIVVVKTRKEAAQ
jgi:hypothetical protein